MPAANVKVEASFQNPTWQAFWKYAIPIIEADTFTLTQQEAPDANIARFRLAELINEKLYAGMKSAVLGNAGLGDRFDKLTDRRKGTPLPTGTRNAELGDAGLGAQTDAGLDEPSAHSSGLGEPTDQTMWSSAADYVISPYDIVIFSFTPANAGTPDNANGIHGKFDFRVTPPESLQSAYSSGTITASPVANDISTSLNDPLRAYVQNGVLHVTGLTNGAQWSVYNLSGVLIYTGIAVETHGRASLPERGVYIITSNGKTVKIIN